MRAFITSIKPVGSSTIRPASGVKGLTKHINTAKEKLVLAFNALERSVAKDTNTLRQSIIQEIAHVHVETDSDLTDSDVNKTVLKLAEKVH